MVKPKIIFRFRRLQVHRKLAVRDALLGTPGKESTGKMIMGRVEIRPRMQRNAIMLLGESRILDDSNERLVTPR